MLFKLGWLKSIFNETVGILDEEMIIERVITDSREEATNCLFIPIVGDNFDAHDFVNQAIDNGARAILWQKNRQLPEITYDDAVFFLVDDTLEALQELAKAYRNKVNPTVIGITGSNGKTTTKDLMYTVLKEKYVTHATKGNYNNHIGMPLTILSMSNDVDMLVLEMGMNDFKEIERLSHIAQPDYAIITNIGESHIEYLGSREGIKRAKLEISEGLKAEGKLIVDGDERLLKDMINQSNVISCGVEETNDIQITHVDIKEDETSFQLKDEEEIKTFVIPLLGRHHTYNAAYCYAIAKQLNVSDECIQKGFKSLKVTGMRFEMLEGLNDSVLINDAYNASPTSMKATINVVKEMKQYEKKIIVLGDVFELGDQSELLHRSIADVILKPINILFTYGDQAKYISNQASTNNTEVFVKHFSSEEALVEAIKKELNEQTLVLFKASRGMAFETIISHLEMSNN
ncbi:MAG TPA: UDP-N-acetylmuramoyl-tripeptide--D-alanyl-D-alanine ligase [Bacillota bacterium]|nr:UDP-N-acetylmuramoyl-tripeptide--D-alanyl-D-alanine ligase [Bacillota bacterium]